MLKPVKSPLLFFDINENFQMIVVEEKAKKSKFYAVNVKKFTENEISKTKQQTSTYWKKL